MKILHAAETITGGVGTVMRLLVGHQVAKPDYEVVALVPDVQADQMGETPLPCLRTFERTGRNAASFYAFSAAFTRLVWDERPDVVHLHSSFAGFLGRLVLMALWPLRRPKVVYCPHGAAFIMAVSPWKRRFYAVIEAFLLLMTDRFVCVSRFERNVTVKAGLNARKVVTIYNGVPAVGKVKASVTKGPLKLLFVGRFDRAKGFDTLVEAMALLPAKDFHLTAVGASVLDGFVPPALPHITYTGWQGPEGVLDAMQACDVLVMPSRWEGFGLAAAEAMACGRAVVASRVAALPEVVEDGVTGRLFAVGDVAALEKVLKGLTRAEWQAMGIAGLARYKANFTLDRMLAATDALYAEVAG